MGIRSRCCSNRSSRSSNHSHSSSTVGSGGSGGGGSSSDGKNKHNVARGWNIRLTTSINVSL